MLARLAFFDKPPEWDTSTVSGCVGFVHLVGGDNEGAAALTLFNELVDRQGLYEVKHSSVGSSAAGFARVALFDDPYDALRFDERSQGVLDLMSTLEGFARAWFLVDQDNNCASISLWKDANALDVGGPKLGEWHAKRGDPPLSGRIFAYDVVDAAFD